MSIEILYNSKDGEEWNLTVTPEEFRVLKKRWKREQQMTKKM